MRGCSSGRPTPCSGQAKRSENVSVSPSTTSIVTSRSASASAVSIESVEPLAEVGLHHEPVDDDLDRVLELLVELDLLVEDALLAVHLHAREALAAQLLEQVLVLALAVADDRRVDGEPRPLGQAQHLVDDRLDRLPRDRPAADRAVRPPDARVEQAQVVVDLGHGADGRARVPRGRLLVDRDRRREAVDRVDVGLLHHLQELARVGRERLDVAPLPLGVDRVEGERGLPGARQPGDADERVPRQADGDVLEVVLAGAVNDKLVGGHRGQSSPAPGRNKRSFRDGSSPEARDFLAAAARTGSRARRPRGSRSRGAARRASGRPRRRRIAVERDRRPSSAAHAPDDRAACPCGDHDPGPVPAR